MHKQGLGCSQANRGRPFESFITYANEIYRRQGIAVIHKVPTEFLPLRNGTGKIMGAKVEKKSSVDYMGRYRSIPVAFEAKHTEDTRISFDRVEPHQAEFLDDWILDPCSAAFVLVSFRLNRFYAIPWAFWSMGIKGWEKKQKYEVTAHNMHWITTGMASISEKDMLPEWEIKTGGTTGLPYLGIIDKMTGGIVNEP